ncbi:hypothetical protein J6590_010562 [Homalodisca vitripennis]|nr:hypothetical protein J6590_010562 [Homalodisca vitripennis]
MFRRGEESGGRGGVGEGAMSLAARRGIKRTKHAGARSNSGEGNQLLNRLVIKTRPTSLLMVAQASHYRHGGSGGLSRPKAQIILRNAFEVPPSSDAADLDGFDKGTENSRGLAFGPKAVGTHVLAGLKSYSGSRIWESQDNCRY